MTKEYEKWLDNQSVILDYILYYFAFATPFIIVNFYFFTMRPALLACLFCFYFP